MPDSIRSRLAEVVASASTDWDYEWRVYRSGSGEDPGPCAEYVAARVMAAFPVLSQPEQAEPEWEYSTRARNGFMYETEKTRSDAEATAERSRRTHDYPESPTPHLAREVVRRRKAGPWEVCDE